MKQLLRSIIFMTFIFITGIVSKKYAIPKVIGNTNINKYVKYYVKNITQPNKEEQIFHDDNIIAFVLIALLVLVFSLPIVLYICKKYMSPMHQTNLLPLETS